MLSNEEKVRILLVENGPVLELVKQHVADRDRVRELKVQILTQLGLDPEKVEVWASSHDGAMNAVSIPSKLKLPKKFVQANWTRPDSQGRRRPKRGTAEYNAFFTKDARYTPAEKLIAECLKVPCSIGYKTAGGEGWTSIGRMLRACGFLWMHKDTGPYAIWIPDVEACLAELKAKHKKVKGFKILGGADKWVLDTTGLKPILEEEWALMVAQKNLEDARKKAAFDALPEAGKKNITNAVSKALKGKRA
jgi:hypothetical protein